MSVSHEQADRPASTGSRLPALVRHQRIMDVFAKNGFVSVVDVAQELGVSAMTIRRDLVVLERAGVITRTHGGAIAAETGKPPEEAEEEPLFDSRMARNPEAKRTIAGTAATLVGPKESVGLDVGTSILAFAHELSRRNDLRIFTNSMRAAMDLAGCGSPVYILGGEVRPPEFSVVGSGTVAAVRERYLDRVFIGVSGINEAGIYDFSVEDSEVKRAFIESSGEVVVLCDATKFERRALSRIAGLDAIHVLVTDQPPPPKLAAALQAAGTRVIVAGSADKVGEDSA